MSGAGRALLWSFVLSLVVALGCAPAGPSAGPGPLRVFAAASLTEVVGALAQSYDGAVAPSFGGSSALARQIRDGAPADVFLSASPQWIDFLRESRALEGEPVVVARNRLAAVASRGSDLAGGGVDASSLLGHLAPSDRVAIADEGVPAGEYARAALVSLGLLESYRRHLVGQRDVRAVLLAVERGHVPVGFVYTTDAEIADVETLFTFNSAVLPPIEYQAAALRGAADARGARAFLAYLESAAARRLLEGAGFLVPST